MINCRGIPITHTPYRPSFAGTNWIGLRRLQELDVSDNRLTEVPACFLHCFKSLRSFNVSRNKLKVFPDPWACPLQYCRASSNSMESIPDTISIFWKNHLKEMDLSDNCLKELPLHIFQLEALVSLKVSENQLSALPSPNKWTCSQLKSLDLSKNQLGKTEEGAKTKRLSFFTTWSRRDPHTASLIEFPGFLSECLEVLFLNDNQLEAVPQSVCCLKSLNELYLSHNPGIRELPPELGQLSNLWQLDIEELNIGNIPAEVRKEGPSAVLAFLRAHLRKAEKCKLLKMIIVGPPRQGKSTLLEALQTGKVPQMMQNETSIRTTKWELEKPNGVKDKMDSVEFNVWVIGGPASMSTVNQCFFTDKALYVVIWNLALGEEAVANLQSWLLNIEARAPNAAVVVVGTHLDLIDSKFRTERIATLRAYVLSVCRSPSGTRATGYPDITCKHLQHLRSMDALRNFSEFRQEASMLHSLQHPCIVSLIGISIHPLCFALQLAPLGSLNTVLEEHSKGVLFMPLGPMLTFKAAYQIAAGLAYLHRKNIIFCDLKSDNILVWSLETDDPVNIKLSDYGISRQSFHEGALGVEGTPGYQAPEIRPGIVYDEKVDMFSYGMVLFELLSGRRPVLGQHQLQIVKKLSKGIRPVLGLSEEVQFHCLQTLMLQCWDTKPEKRPVALSLLKQMQEPSFPSFKYLLPSERHSQLFLPTEQEHTAVFWDGENEERNYTVVNIEKGLVEVQRMACVGMKLSCQLKIENTLWTATEDHHIYIYTLKGMCPLSTPQKCLPCPSVVTCMLAVPAQKKTLPLVFVGMADGLVAVYTLINDFPDESQSYLCSHTLNKSIFKISDDDPRQNPYPVKVMMLVKSGLEIWYSTGPGILIIDCLTLQAVKRLDPYVYPSTIISMTCNSGCGGEEAVWCLDDKTNTLLMYHAATYQLCARYFCGDSNPLRDMFTVQKPTGVIREPDATPTSSNSTSIDEKGCETNSPGDVTIIYNEETGTQIIRHQDSLTDYCSMSSCSSDRLSQIDMSSSGILNSLASSTSMPFSTDCEESDRWQDQMGMPVPESMDSSPQGDAVEGLQAVKVLAVKDTLWIPRRGGDVIVIELEKGSGTRGRVFAVLKEAALAQRGGLVEAAVVAKDTVVCGFQNENMEWCLAVWRGWGAREFEIFYQSYEELGKLEIGMRKRSPIFIVVPVPLQHELVTFHGDTSYFHVFGLAKDL
ncbi:UNVERIFIED_CONTAM: hypothetical protein FKN15_000672 [Acipenser sinensis]